jgi:flavorubredoxin
MMTYDAKDEILFAGDAFGCFGALPGGFLDTQINTDLFWDEMVRYYSNIVGKYGVPVQKALIKLKAIPVSVICSTHGPVWTGENIPKVIDVYDKLSLYEAKPGVVIVYGSMYGNTEQVAETIAAELAEQGVKPVIVHNVSKSHASYILADIFRYKGLIIGSPTYNLNLFPGIEEILSKIENREVTNRYFSYFSSFCWVKGCSIKHFQSFVERTKFEVVGTPIEVKQSMKEETYTSCEELAKAMADKINN